MLGLEFIFNGLEILFIGLSILQQLYFQLFVRDFRRFGLLSLFLVNWRLPHATLAALCCISEGERRTYDPSLILTFLDKGDSLALMLED